MSDARIAALEIINETIQNGAYANLLFEEKTADLEDRDRRWVTMVVTDTLDNLIHIDYILEQFIGKKSVKPIIRNILRLGVDQLKFLELSPHAVINESVELTKTIKKQQLSGFVNGVLRNIDRTQEITYPKEGSLEYFSIINSKPMWLMKQWQKDYGFENAVEYSKIRKVRTVIRQNLDRYSDFDLENWLDEQGYKYNKLFSGCYSLENSYQIHSSELFRKGIISIQGLGSQFACYAMKPNGKILDACAAPGGKTLLLAQLTSGGNITACDLHEHRLKLISAQLYRGGYSAELLQQDMTIVNDDFIDQFDCVLVDAPCTGLGVLNNKPDILLNKKPEDLKALSGIQKMILATCSKYVKSKGAIVYSTCTLNKIENDMVVDWFLKKFDDFVLDDFVLPTNEKVCGKVQYTPENGEGFFIARMVRK